MTSKHPVSPNSRLPVQIDPIRLAKARKILTGELPLASCKRLIPLLYSPDTANLTVAIEFGVDRENIHFCAGEVTGTLNLVCQRCLEPMEWQLKMPIRLAFVNNEFEAENLPGDYESHILHSVPVAMSDIIEDELLLAMPQVPMHPVNDCTASEILNELTSDDHAAEVKENPFTALASLQKQHD